MPAILSLNVAPDESGDAVLTPEVDGHSLITLVTDFEAARGDERPGGYMGLIPAMFTFGDLGLYFLGTEPDQWPEPGLAWLLGCSCGELGCLPLQVRISADHETVRWSEFSRPINTDLDYSGFGPFVFDRVQYDHAVLAAMATLVPGDA